MNRYGASFKFLDDEVINSPSCLYGHDYTDDFEVFVYLKYSSMLSVFSRRPKVFVNVICFLSYTFSIRIPINDTVKIRLSQDSIYIPLFSDTSKILFEYRQYS
uniref:Uncharacterized protein n=1 Tax=Brassica oleracea TaxID=3712 RepID=A0A3P6DTM5_BRAOL|nr:unnamed protein product [Brassica oleracea]